MGWRNLVSLNEPHMRQATDDALLFMNETFDKSVIDFQSYRLPVKTPTDANATHISDLLLCRVHLAIIV